jgi:hypothetical protein
MGCTTIDLMSVLIGRPSHTPSVSQRLPALDIVVRVDADFLQRDEVFAEGLIAPGFASAAYQAARHPPRVGRMVFISREPS